ncbi:MAG: PQQ-binding-like beta-propeller repeat protein [Planctomycetota bacterium]
MLCRIVLIGIMGISPALAQEAAGWRTDGTGKYPSATPVTEWSTTKNVVWKTKMPSWGNATPVLAGGKIFVCSEPATLVCVDAKDGKILWTKANTYIDTLAPDDAARARADVKKAEELAAQMKPVENELRTIGNEQKKIGQELKKIADVLKPRPNPPPGQPDPSEEERKQDEARTAELKKRAEDLNKRLAELKLRAEAPRRQLDELKKQRSRLKLYRRPATADANGYSSSTPVSDDTHVYALFGNGVAACYDLAGNRRWITLVERPKHGWGHSASPVLAGGKLIVHILGLTALDATTGKVAWRTKAAVRWGTAVVTRVGDVDVLVTPAGDIVRITDGKALARNVSGLTYCAPIVHDGIAYFVEHGGKAVQLSPGPENGVTVKPLWTTRPRNDRYYASPVLHDGLIYAITQNAHFSVIDAKTGAIVHQRPLKFGGGQAYSSVTLAGPHLFLSRQDGTTVVMTLGREPKQVAMNKLELFRCCPVFDGKRMYIRAAANLYCIGE